MVPLHVPRALSLEKEREEALVGAEDADRNDRGEAARHVAAPSSHPYVRLFLFLIRVVVGQKEL